MRTPYNTPPIAEALCEVQFDTSAFLAPHGVYERVKDLYDTPPEPQKTIHVSASSSGISIGRPEGMPVMLARSSDGRRAARIGSDLVSAHVYEPYPNWSGFKPDIDRLIESYVEITGATGARRVGLRYVNRITLPRSNDGTMQFERFLNVGKVSPDGFPQHLTNVFSRVEHRYDDGTKLLFAFGTVNVDEATTTLLLDFDVIHDAGTPVESLDSIIERLHDLEGEAFEASITDAYREVINR